MAPTTSDPADSSGGNDRDLAIDCATCPVRAVACGDCVVSVLIGPPELDRDAADALIVLADRGLVPPLQDPRERPRRVG